MTDVGQMQNQDRKIRMRTEMTVAIVSGAIGLFAGIVGAVIVGGITYSIETRKLAIEGIQGPSTSLHEKRVELCREMIIAGRQASHNFYQVWYLTDNPPEMTPAEAAKALAALVSQDTLAKELERLASVCSIFSTPELVEVFTTLTQQYQKMMKNPNHIVALEGMDTGIPLVNAIRHEIGTDELSAHLLQQLQIGGKPASTYSTK